VWPTSIARRVWSWILEDSVAAFEGAGTSSGCAPRRGGCSSAAGDRRHRLAPNSELLAERERLSTTACSWTRVCRTSAADVYAAGDVANHLHPIFGRLRVEHWNNGQHQGRARAGPMLGVAEPYAYVHSFWSDQYSTLSSTSGLRGLGRLVFRGGRRPQVPRVST